MLRFLGPAALLAASAFAQTPSFEAGKVQIPNSNDTTPLGPGQLISIYGSYLGPSEPCQGHASSLPSRDREGAVLNPSSPSRPLVYPEELCGVRVLVGGEPAGLLYVHRDQINFKVPQSVPMEGTVGLQVVHRDQASTVVPIEAGLAPLRLIVQEPAFTNMPIWVQVKIPPNRASPIRYPYPLGPSDIGCNELQIRKDGRLLEKHPSALFNGGVFAGLMCGSSALGERYQNRLPLHMLYRIDDPGAYEVRLNMGHTSVSTRALTSAEIDVQSEWTPLRVEASTGNHRRVWLAGLTRSPPVAPEDLIADYLPSILGVPDEQSLEAVIAQLYHPHPRVTQFAAKGLDYWPLPEALEAVQRTVERRGPSAAAAEWLSRRRANGANHLALVEAVLPYLHTSDPVALRGAVRVVRGLGRLQITEIPPELRERTLAAMLEAEKYVLASGDDPTSQDYVRALGVFGEERATPLLWRFVDEGIALGASLRAIAHIARPEDLPRLAAFIDMKHMPRDYYSQTDDLLGVLFTAYGADALPYVERVIQETVRDSLRDIAGRCLVAANLPEAWAFIAEAIENDAPYKADLMRYMGALYPESNATQSAMLALSRRLAASPRP